MRFVSLVFTALILTGCVGAVPPLDGLSYIASDKGFVDHIISYGSGKNCSGVRVEQGQTYCEEDEITVRPKVHCYRTLANVTCYTEADPHKTGQRVIGNNEHNLPN